MARKIRRTNRKNSKRLNSKRRSKVYNRQSRLFKYGGVGPGEPRTAPAPEAVQKRVNFGKVQDVDDGDSHDLYECPPPKQYSNFQGMPGKLKRSEIYKMALDDGRRKEENRRTFEVIENLCGSETPYLTDNGYCCSPTVE